MNEKIILTIGQGKDNKKLIDILSKATITHEHKWTPVNDNTRDVKCEVCGIKAMRSGLHFR